MADQFVQLCEDNGLIIDKADRDSAWGRRQRRHSYKHVGAGGGVGGKRAAFHIDASTLYACTLTAL